MNVYNERQKEILDISIELISEKGIQGLTIKNLAEKIGISEPAIYRHFKNKLAILMALLNLFKRQIEENYDAVIKENLSSKKSVEKMFDIYIDNFMANPHLSSVIFSENLFKNKPELSPIIKEVMSMNMKRLSKIIEDGQKKNEIRNDIPAKVISTIILGSLRMLIKEWNQNNFKTDLKTYGNELKEALIKMITTRTELTGSN